MNVYQKLLNKIVQRDTDIPKCMTFREARCTWRKNLKSTNGNYEFLKYMKNNKRGV
ncbi:MAG TPA: hypothetical protein VIK72_19510 [Clostridiaceae bacterium]